MSKRNRLRKQAASAAEAAIPDPVALKLGNHQFRAFNGLDCAFGANLADYPPYDSIPEEYRRGNTPANKAVSTLFFKGGKLEDFGLRLKAGVDQSAFFRTLKAMLHSFDPKHEHKEAACAWLVAEFTEPSR